MTLVLVIVAATACSTSQGGGDIPDSGASNPPFTPVDQIGTVVTSDTDTSAHIVIANTPQLCSDAKASPPIDRKGQKFVTIELADVSGAAMSAPSAPGTYTIYPNTGSRPAKSASFVAGALDTTCVSDDTEALGQSGSVVLTALTGGRYQGSYDVVLNTGDHVTGSFDSAPCPELATAIDATPRSCM